MSHDVFIRAVPIWDEPALHSAVADLKARGVNCELRKDSFARMWNGRPKAGAFVLHLPESEFDVAFVREQDGHLTPVCDIYGGEVMSQIGWPDYRPTGETSQERQQESEMANIGRLMQGYSNHALRNAVQNDGFTIIDESIDATGQLQISYQ